MKNKINKEIQRIKEKLIKKYKPEKIILFGSAASGELSKESDLDIFMVKKTSLSFTQRYVRVASLFPKRTTPIDFIVYTPEEFLQAQKQKRFFLEQLLKSGKILYEKK